MSKQIRVLQIPTGLFGSGEQKISRDIGLHRDRNKYDIHYVVFSSETERYEKQLIDAGCPIYHCPLSYPRPLYYYMLYKTLKEMMIEQHYDVVHAHCMFQSGIVMLAAKHAGVPIRIVHSHNAGKHKSLFSSIYDEVMRLLIFANATTLVACGNEAGRFLFGAKTFEKKGKLILNGIDQERFQFSGVARDQIREKLGLDGRFVIGHVGRLCKAKNQKYLIRCMPEILKELPNAALVLVGEGPDRQELESVVETLGLQKYVFFVGAVDNVEDYLSAMDVFVLPSLFEGMPLVILEAQSEGLPCIVSENVPDDVFKTGHTIAVPLDRPTEWIREICACAAVAEECSQSKYKYTGVDERSMLEQIYTLYSFGK